MLLPANLLFCLSQKGSLDLVEPCVGHVLQAFTQLWSFVSAIVFIKEEESESHLLKQSLFSRRRRIQAEIIFISQSLDITESSYLRASFQVGWKKLGFFLMKFHFLFWSSWKIWTKTNWRRSCVGDPCKWTWNVLQTAFLLPKCSKRLNWQIYLAKVYDKVMSKSTKQTKNRQLFSFWRMHTNCKCC